MFIRPLILPALNLSASELNSSATNASTSLSAILAPKPPDFCWCFNPKDSWYFHPKRPLLSDCRRALNLLPSGNEAAAWYPAPTADERRQREDVNLLPLTATYGTCSIQLHTSGPSAPHLSPLYLVPNQVRAMASWVLARCVYVGKGGLITRNLTNLVDYLTAPSTSLGDPFPTNASFLSLHIAHFEPPISYDWNPGDNDPVVGLVVAEEIEKAARAAPVGSQRREDLEERVWRIDSAVNGMERMEEGKSWWDGLV